MRLIAGLLAFVLVAAACTGSDDDDSGPVGLPTNDGVSIGAGEAVPLGLRLSEGQAAEGEVVVPIRLEGQELDEGAVDAILDRLPPLTEDEADAVDFQLPPGSLPPPRSGEEIDVAFGTDDDAGEPPEVATGPLEVVRFQPEGEVPIAPFLSITFNQPMVPITTVGQLQDSDVPVTITPALEGSWEWIGTRTLRFEPTSATTANEADRLPMATSFTVEVPAGTTSETGGTLDRAVSWQFETPPPQLRRFVPDGREDLPLQPVFFASFDQNIEPAEVLAATTVEANGQSVEIRLATDDEIDADDDARRQVSSATDGRWLAFTPVEAFPVATTIRAVIGPGVPSAEGPLENDEIESRTNITYGPLRAAAACSDDRRCWLGEPLRIAFNNELDLDASAQATIEVSPEIPGMAIDVTPGGVVIRGLTAGNTTYSVELSEEFTDVHGQSLDGDRTVEFSVQSADPAIFGFDGRFVTLDPLAPEPTVDLATINVDKIRVRLYEVALSDFDQFQNYAARLDDFEQGPPGSQVADFELDIDANDDEVAVTSIPLDEHLDDGVGHLVVRVDPAGDQANPSDDEYWLRPHAVWAQGTNIGLDTLSAEQEVVVWATALDSGEPLEGVEVGIGTGQGTHTTDSDGLAALTARGEQRLLVARSGNDSAILERWGGEARTSDTLRWYVIDDRGIYKPGETVSIKGWVRNLALSGSGGLELFDFAGGDGSIRWAATDPRGADLASGEASVSALGGFHFEIDLPEEANLGFAQVRIDVTGNGDTHVHPFRIDQFRRPEFEVTARTESEGPHLMTAPVTVAAEAAYFSGGPLPEAPVEWTVSTQDASYQPPGLDRYTFGRWIPWWYTDGFGPGEFDEFNDFNDFGPGFGPEAEVERFTGSTDGSGTHYLQIDFGDTTEQDGPRTVVANAAVTDVNRQVWAADVPVLVHSGQLYAGLRTERTFVRQGDPLDVDVIVADIDGELVAGRSVDVVAERLEWRYQDGAWSEVGTDAQTCEVTSPAEASDDDASCRFETEIGGRYRISAVVADDAGGQNRTEMTRWVSGGRGRPSSRVDLETVELVPDSQDYQPGDTASILVQSPFGPAQGLLTVTRNGIESTETFIVEEDTAVIEIPIVEANIPNLGVRVDLVGTTARTDAAGNEVDGPDRPAFAAGAIELAIPPLARTLEVTAVPDPTQVDADGAVGPGDDTAIEVTVVDAEGRPVSGAEVAVIVVDEAVLALTNYELTDPIDRFYQRLDTWLDANLGRRSIRLQQLEQLLSEGSDTATTSAESASDDSDDEAMLDAAAPDALAGEGATDRAAAAPTAPGQGQGDPIALRSDFSALAIFAPEVSTGSDGTARVPVSLPDNVTRYRIMAVAVDGSEQFGSTEDNLVARLPVTARPSAPRFLNFGDEFEFPVVVQNQTSEDIEVDVVIQTANLSTVGPVGRRVTVPANNRVEVPFRARAERAGEAVIQTVVASDDGVDAVLTTLPVFTPATTEAFATYGIVDDGAVVQPVARPDGVVDQFGGLEVNTSSTAIAALTDAVIYINDYRYQSADGAASRILSISALDDVLEAFNAEELPSAAEIRAGLAASVQVLEGLQNGDGGFASWRVGRPSSPYTSVHATHALVVARANGVAVNDETLNNALWYLQNIDQYLPSWYSDRSRATINAYAVHVRHLAGESDPNRASEVYRTYRDDLSLDGLAWLWPVVDSTDPTIAGEIEQTINNSVTETAASATFVSGYTDDDYVLLGSDRRTDGIVLGALISQRPGSDLIPKVVDGLLANRVRGHWGNMQENTFILLALNAYFRTFEDVEPDFVARAWLGSTYAVEHAYAGRTAEQQQSFLPMNLLTDQNTDPDLVVAKDGDGRLYYRIGLRYAPADLALEPLDRGFVVERTYEALDDPGAVEREADGSWRIEAGTEVRVRVTMVADSRRNHVALVDPLPAGLEVLNPALSVTPDLSPETDRELVEEEFADDSIGGGRSAEPWRSWWWGPWFEHQNLRDDRAEAFASQVQAGTYTYSYVARATTPGRFVVPPPKAEEIFAPETFGRGGTDVVVITP